MGDAIRCPWAVVIHFGDTSEKDDEKEDKSDIVMYFFGQGKKR